MVKALGKVKVDEAAVKILSAPDVHGELQKIAARGARYGFPGWALEETTKTGKVKRRYLEGSDVEDKAREIPRRRRHAAELVGRQVSLLVMARMADEDALANSARSFYQLNVQTTHACMTATAGRPGCRGWRNSPRTDVEVPTMQSVGPVLRSTRGGPRPHAGGPFVPIGFV